MSDDQLTPENSENKEQEGTQTTTEAPKEESVDQNQGEAAPEQPAEKQEAPDPQSSTDTSESKGDQLSDDDLFQQELARLEGGEEDAGESNRARLSRGERVEATVIQVEPQRVFVNLGTKAEGVVELSELSIEPIDTAVGNVEVGQKFEVVVIKPVGTDGNPVVSKKRADADLAWKRIVDSFEEGKTFQAQVVDRVKGGLVVDIGVRGFVPATHVGNGKLRNIEKFVGETLPVKIIEVDRERRKVVLSNRVAEEEKREEIKEDLFSSATPGDVMSGTVRRLTDYGAFVDLGGIDGLLHISEMSWVRIDHPKEVLKEGEDIKVMILRLDPDNGRISLGLRQVLPDPWETIRENYKTGQKIKVNVSRMVQSGAFVKLPEGAEAFLPLSEMSNKRIKRPQDVLEENQEIEPTILDLKPDERRMVLSIREGGSREAYDPFSQRNKRGGGRRRREEPAKADERMTPSGGATIGERLGMLKGILKGGESAEGESAQEQTAEKPQKAEKPEKPEKAEKAEKAERKPQEQKTEEPKAEQSKAEEEKPKEEAPKEEKADAKGDEGSPETKE